MNTCNELKTAMRPKPIVANHRENQFLVHETSKLHELHNQFGKFGLTVNGVLIAEICLTGKSQNQNIVSIRSSSILKARGFGDVQISMGLLLFNGIPISVHRGKFPTVGNVKRLTSNINMEMSDLKLTFSVKEAEESRSVYSLGQLRDKMSTNTKNPVIKIGSMDLPRALAFLCEYKSLAPIPLKDRFPIRLMDQNREFIETSIQSTASLSFGYTEVPAVRKKIQHLVFP